MNSSRALLRLMIRYSVHILPLLPLTPIDDTSQLQCFSKLCRISLNNFCCATVSHSSAWHKSWGKHDLNEVASLILAWNIMIKIYWLPSNSSNIYVKPHSVILTYILILIHFCDYINMLPQWF
jgi:hypothetical protein